MENENTKEQAEKNKRVASNIYKELMELKSKSKGESKDTIVNKKKRIKIYRNALLLAWEPPRFR